MKAEKTPRHEVTQCTQHKPSIIVGLSGGIDSVYLMAWLDQQQYTLIAAHCNFHLRGDESDRDEAFVRSLMDKYFPSHRLLVRHFDTEEYARQYKVSIEMAARQQRYEWFESLRQTYQADLIAVGHHKGDQQETILLNLIRGTGGEGLTGMSILNGHLYRPLLDLTREEITTEVIRLKLPYIEDSSNKNTLFRRNLIRHKILPIIKEINPSFDHSFERSRQIFEAEQAIISDTVSSFIEQYFSTDRMLINLAQVENKRHLPLLLYRLLSTYRFTYTQVMDMLNRLSHSGSLFHSTDGTYLIERFREQLFLITPSTLSIQTPSSLRSNASTSTNTLIGSFTISDKPLPDAIALRFSSLSLTDRDIFTIRLATKQDSFTPLGMKRGKKKVFEFLKEQGIPASYRPYTPILVNNGTIIAVLPFRISHQVRVEDQEEESLQFINWVPSNHPYAAIIKLLITNQKSQV